MGTLPQLLKAHFTSARESLRRRHIALRIGMAIYKDSLERYFYVLPITKAAFSCCYLPVTLHQIDCELSVQNGHPEGKKTVSWLTAYDPG